MAAFIQFEKIKGDCTEKGHENWIEVLSFSHAVAMAVSGTGMAAGAHASGKTMHQDFSITKFLDSASPTLALFCSKGTHIPNVKFELWRAMGDKTRYMMYELKDCIISSVSVGGTSEDIASEEVSIHYSQMKWTYTPTTPEKGAAKKADVIAGFNLAKNEQV
ncbi:MAG TPA: type VI secretion system tube protein Hcp [Planctomycetota bacterium]|nr:type VI secretion system tube protein Hcp [Planctomycetota bacterium]